MRRIPHRLSAAIRKTVFFVHLWFGLIVGLYFVILGLSGSLLVFHEELEAKQFPELARVAPPMPGAKPLPLSEVLAALKRQYPQAKESELAAISMPGAAGGAYHIHLGDYDRVATLRVATIDPYTGRVIRDVPALQTPLGFALLLHIYLLLGTKGLLVNGVGGLLAGLLVATGVWLWWPAAARQWKARLTIKRGAGTKRLIHDLHNVFGMYALPMLLVATLTGAMFGFYTPVQRAVYALTGSPQDPETPKIEAPAGAQRLPVETLARIAERTVPDAKLMSVTYPTEPEQPFSAWKRVSQAGFLNWVEVAIDPYAGTVLVAQDDRTASSGKRAMRFLGALHFGWWGGWITKILYCLVGFAPLALFVTGVWKYALLRRGKRQNRERRRLAARRERQPEVREEELPAAAAAVHASTN